MSQNSNAISSTINGHEIHIKRPNLRQQLLLGLLLLIFPLFIAPTHRACQPTESNNCGYSTCSESDTCCNYECVDTGNDPDNCGACGTKCDEDETCDHGECLCKGDACEVNERCCGGNCVDITRNNGNCGACNNVCWDFASFCLNGFCACSDHGVFGTCLDNETCCGFEFGCRDISNDPRSCGICGFSCGAGENCVDGHCTCGELVAPAGIDMCGNELACCGEPPFCYELENCQCGTSICEAGFNCCAYQDGPPGSPKVDRCVDLKRNRLHCGLCGNECKDGHICERAMCVCPEDRPDCDGDNSCKNLLVDGKNCGSCGKVCPAGQVCDGTGTCKLTCQPGLVNCFGTCTKLNKDRLNCGACGDACPEGKVCDGTGSCALSCQWGLVNCDEQCVKLDRDRLNCGVCGNTCRQGFVCDHGECAVSCQAGFMACDHECVDLSSDNENCGACNSACESGEICDGSGNCALACMNGLTKCGDQCVDLDNNRDNCGSCGNVCPSGEVCDDAGHCSLTCTETRSQCRGQCVDLLSDEFNCGMCGLACMDGEFCAAGLCDDQGFRVPTLTADSCISRQDGSQTGGPYGPLVANNYYLVYRGRIDTIVYELSSFYSSATSVPEYETLVSNLATGNIYTFAANGIPASVGERVDALLKIDQDGWYTDDALSLSQPFVLEAGSGLFSGWGRVLVRSPDAVKHVDMATGLVSTLPIHGRPSPALCVSPFYWGVVESHDGGLFLLYVGQGTNSIVRRRVSDGAEAFAAEFTDLGDACGLAVSPVTNRWYTHTSAESQFGLGERTNSCDAIVWQY